MSEQVPLLSSFSPPSPLTFRLPPLHYFPLPKIMHAERRTRKSVCDVRRPADLGRWGAGRKGRVFLLHKQYSECDWERKSASLIVTDRTLSLDDAKWKYFSSANGD